MRRIIILCYLYCIHFPSFPHFKYIIIGKTNINELITRKSSSKITDIFIFCLTIILNYRILNIPAIFSILIHCCFAIQNTPCDNYSIIIKNCFYVIKTLKSISCFIIF